MSLDDMRKALATPMNIGGGFDSERYAIPRIPEELINPPRVSIAVARPIWETQAELFMEGLKAQAEQLEASLKPDQELLMICWHGHEKFQVLNVTMPSHNVVALTCVDAEGETTQVTGHMNSVTFSFRIVTPKEPVQPRPIDFDMPGRE